MSSLLSQVYYRHTEFAIENCRILHKNKTEMTGSNGQNDCFREAADRRAATAGGSLTRSPNGNIILFIRHPAVWVVYAQTRDCR